MLAATRGVGVPACRRLGSASLRVILSLRVIVSPGPGSAAAAARVAGGSPT